MSVLMFHSVGCENENWYRNWLSVSLDHFERFCQFLVEKNYETVHLEDWYNSSSDSNSSASKQVVLTFDDGYLDNWVYVYPILKKYNLKGTIFVNPEFVDDSIDIRKNLDDVWNHNIQRKQLKPLGFLNWSEIKELDASGVMDIQSHSMSHNFYFKSNKIKCIYENQPQYDWLAWYHKPKHKPYYITENQTHFIPNGTPIFEYGRALALRRYFPDETLVKYAIDLYSDTPKTKNNTLLIEKLNKKILDFPGRYETDEEMEKRYRYELFDSKRILEEKLNKKVAFLCWPGGGYNELSVGLSKEAGYKASTCSYKDKHLSDNNSDNTYKRIKRFSMTSFISTPSKNHYIKRSNYLINVFKAGEGRLFNKNLYKAQKLGLMIKDKIIR